VFRRIALSLLVTCSVLSTTAGAAPRTAREAAQHGLEFLAADTARWQVENRCYGCHVQAVALEGLAIGRRNQYRVPGASMNEVLRGMLTLSGGARTPGGLSHPALPRTSKTFGAAAFARYDALVDGAYTPELLVLAKELIAFQGDDGRVTGDHVSPPVTTGPVQATFQAAQAWRQAYARTADADWLVPLRLAETFLQKEASRLGETIQAANQQDLAYVTMGLLVSGASPAEPAVRRLLEAIESRRHEDGGWGFDGAASSAFATGQAVATLRLAGHSENDRVVAGGLRWLAAHQAKDGGWGHGGSGRAEAMWAVLGLVSVDVLALDLTGAVDGQRLDGTVELSASARGNGEAKPKTLELLVDDRSVRRVDSPGLGYTLRTNTLAPGPHTLDLVATDSKGRSSRRRFVVFTGDHFLTDLGTRFSDGATRISLRNIAPAGLTGTLRFEVRGTGADAGDKVLFTREQPATPGAVSFAVSGSKSRDGLPNGRYEATVSFVDGAGKARHRVTLVFVHDTPEAQRTFAEVEGRLELARDGAGAANATVELVDETGRVVQRVTSNEAGQYRFKGVDAAKYRVRVTKDGFRAEDMAVDAKAGAPAAASVSLH